MIIFYMLCLLFCLHRSCWNNADATLLQVPHFTPQIISALTKENVTTVVELLELDDDVRTNLLGLPPSQLADVAMFCNAYPDLEMTFETEFDVRGLFLI